MLELIKPKAVQPGDTVGVVTPDLIDMSQTAERVERGVSELKRLGFAVKVAKYATMRLNSSSLPSPTREERAADFNQLVSDSSVDFILQMRGGNAASVAEVLPLINYDGLRDQPKVIVGFSSFTILLNAITARTGLVTFHGPQLLRNFGTWREGLDDFTWESLLEVISGKLHTYSWSPWFADNYEDYTQDLGKVVERRAGRTWQPLHPGKSMGRLIGSVWSGFWIEHLPEDYWPRFESNLLFWDEPVVTPDFSSTASVLTALQGSSLWPRAVGMIVGKPQLLNLPSGNHDEHHGAYEANLMDVCRDLGLPAIGGVDCGHTKPMVTFPIGIMTEIDASQLIIRLAEPAVQV